MHTAGSPWLTNTKKYSQSDMRILHYSLGFPPYRSGGLTKFCMDLMRQQVSNGHDVGLLWPGKISLLSSEVRVAYRGTKQYNGAKICSFELINPLPVPYDEGITDYERFTANCDESIYRAFLNSFAPDVIHIHTFMGLHESFFKAAKEMGIRMTYTTHDYFPICPKVTMFRKGGLCTCVDSCKECSSCNKTALNLNEIKILQSPMYRLIKDTSVIKPLRKQHRNSFFMDDNKESAYVKTDSNCDYQKLREYYKRLLEYSDIVHFNSTVAQDIYTKYFGDIKGCVIGLSHSDIKDKRKKKNFSDDMIRMRYLGNYSGAKGFPFLKQTLDRLWETKKNFHLDIHFDCPGENEYITTNDRYTYSDFESIFDSTDILIVPSLWYETFGFTVLEALSFGVPVIITDRVGAKDLLSEGSGIVVDLSDKEDLYKILDKLDANQLAECNDHIVKHQHIMLMNEVAESIERYVYGW